MKKIVYAGVELKENKNPTFTSDKYLNLFAILCGGSTDTWIADKKSYTIEGIGEFIFIGILDYSKFLILINKEYNYSFYNIETKEYFKTNIDFKNYFLRAFEKNSTKAIFIKNYTKGAFSEYVIYDLSNGKEVFQRDVLESVKDNGADGDNVISYFNGSDLWLASLREIYNNSFYNNSKEENVKIIISELNKEIK